MPALPSHSSRERPIKIGILIWPHYNQFETILMNLKGAKKRKNGKNKLMLSVCENWKRAIVSLETTNLTRSLLCYSLSLSETFLLLLLKEHT